jgi:drug/metabolite transporter (DMT)-like permease
MQRIRNNPQGYGGLMMGLMAGTFAATLIRLAQEAGMPSLPLAAGRLGIAAVVLLPFGLRSGWDDMRHLSRREWVLVLLAGLLIGVHFATFVSALEYTSVLTTLVLTGTTPFFAAFIGWATLGERPQRNVWIGIGLALVGTLLVALGGDGGDPPTRTAPLLGGGLALSAALAIGVYFTIGRQVRGKLSTITYSGLVFGIGSLSLFLILPLFDQAIVGHSLEAYLWTLAAAIIAQIIGHSGWNMALGGFPAVIVSLWLLMVPVTGTLVALLILLEVPNGLAIAGSAVIMTGIGIAVVGRR